MKKHLLSLIALSIFFLSCSENKEEKNEKSDNSDTQEVANDTQEAGDIIEKIDAYVTSEDSKLETYGQMNSLPFANLADKLEFQSFFLYDEAGKLKAIEYYSNTDKSQDVSRFYYDNDALVYASEAHSDYDNDENFIEKKYYFNEGNVIKVVETKGFSDVKVAELPLDGQNISNQTALDLMEFKGDFEISFAGFIEQPGGVFLIVNAKKPGFNSALVVDEKGADEFMKDLYDNQKKYMGKKMIVKWEAVVNPSNGMRQNAYRGGEWVE
ncbi:MAG: hypothetical protein KDC84_05285 [Crocinitomicaceae bacterium]|nr:hypothetical protein [Crocinitomicaceae bacterium]